MQDESFKDTLNNETKIADDVVRLIAGLATTEVEGVVGMSSGLIANLAQLLGKEDFSKGVKCYIKENTIALDVYVIVQYGYRIPDVAVAIQRQVKAQVESMTGMEVIEVNVNIQGVSVPKKVTSIFEE
ncbi:Asp23/Gls24 family envelope stress response protein [Succinispira mobilis]|mgnify:CR=1 FL=1|uniref:Asp23/Gls24 family envelope stress response protein n=1 Tax=Succinispira mobilis TaxID=78120 RepID=UPI00037A41A8|nr:Asp23/Gls24 family envelope stress response protein [Succinispira mobilis]